MGFYLNDVMVVEGLSLRDRVSKLFDEMAHDNQLRNVFIKNPLLVLESRLLPEGTKLSNKESLNQANEFLYSVISNDKFSEWLAKYNDQLIQDYNKTKTLPDRDAIRVEVAKAILEFGDERIVSGLLRDTDIASGIRPALQTSDEQEGNVAICLLVFVFLFVVVTIPPLARGDPYALDENLNMVRVDAREFRSISEQLINYAKSRTQ